MSRPLRISYAGAWYHVMNRGANRQKIFHSNKQYEIFIKLLEQIYERYQIETHAYCLMPNHYHLLIRTPLPNISRAMRHLDGVYTQKYNRLEGKDGPLMRGRFKSIVVDAEHYLLSLNRYIHLNPVNAKLTSAPQNYKWSSYPAYMGLAQQPAWLFINETLARFDNNLQKYQAFISKNSGSDIKTAFLKMTKKVPILGNAEFIKHISDKYLSDDNIKNNEISEYNIVKKVIAPSYDAILAEVAKCCNVDKEHVTYSAKGKTNIAREILIYLIYTKTHNIVF